jgi:uncharacterized protein YehS (DUF1456 family)
MLHIDEIRMSEDGTMVVSFSSKKEKYGVLEGVRSIRFFENGEVHFVTEKKEYLYVSDKFVSADKITFYEKHRAAYALKNGNLHTLFWDDKELFSIDDPDVRNVAIKNENEWIVSCKEEFFRYLNGKRVEKFTLRDFKITPEKKEE